MRLADGRITYQPVFGRERRLHASSVVQVVRLRGNDRANIPRIALLDADRGLLLKITGGPTISWSGTTNRPDVLTS